MNFNGIIVAVATGILIWFGHIWVVKLFKWSGTKLWFVPLIAGFIFMTASLNLENDTLSAVFAIGAVTFFWGIKELFEYKQKYNQQI
ncbi:MAG: DUF4491 family protein [Bacteroidota bacterium]|nr:DUF4491 family protein [Bacteroidota bacterium]